MAGPPDPGGLVPVSWFSCAPKTARPESRQSRNVRLVCFTFSPSWPSHPSINNVREILPELKQINKDEAMEILAIFE
jgi:hypothetical protein